MKTKQRKVGIVGCGKVGMSYAFSLMHSGVCDQLVLIDKDKRRVWAEAEDLRHGLCHLGRTTEVWAGDFCDLKDADILVIAAGVAQREGEDRMALLQRNAAVFEEVVGNVKDSGFKGIYLIATNPVDIMTRLCHDLSGADSRRVIGSGTILDSARLRVILSRFFAVDPKNVHAYVLGEHGDSAFVPWSIANISNVPVCDYKDAIQNGGDYPDIDHEDVENYVRKSGATVIQRKGATFYAVSMSVCHLCKCLLSGIDTTLTVSTMLHGEYGIDDVCLSLLSIVGKHGATGKILLPLNDEEVKALHNSADCLKNIINNIEI